MRIRSKLLLKELEKLGKSFQKKVNDIDHKMNYSPASELIDVHKAFHELLEKNKGKQRLSKEFMRKVDLLDSKQKKAKAAIEADTVDFYDRLIEKKITLQNAIGEINNILYYSRREQNQ